MFNSFNTPVNSWEIVKGFPNGNNYIHYSQELAHLDSNITPSFQAGCEQTIPINVRMTEDYDETWWRGLFYTVAQKGHTCKLKMLLQTKNFTCKLKIGHAN